MIELVAATRNEGKLREIKAVLEAAVSGFVLLSLRDFPSIDEAMETGDTFEANAVLKAEALRTATALHALADDSGLEVDALSGFPGVRSARFLGPDAFDADRNAALVARLRGEGIPEDHWQARFVCALALALPGGATHVFRGECQGILVPEPRGTHGFGYDPIFLRPEMGRTLAELTKDEKNAISHRGQALRRLTEALPGLLDAGQNVCDSPKCQRPPSLPLA